MSDEAGLLRAICEGPDDDTPRLAYADWLEENGQALRAQFIRAQCRCAAASAANQAPFTSWSAEDLPPEYRAALLEPLLELGLWECANAQYSGGTSGLAFYFRRGFVEDLVVRGEEGATRFIECAEELFARAPLRHLRFEPALFADSSEVDVLLPARLRALASLPHLERLQTLDLSQLDFWTGDLPALRDLRQRLGTALLPREPWPQPEDLVHFQEDEDIPF
jgi:uncharacterized protein (TIGR02996 family)